MVEVFAWGKSLTVFISGGAATEGSTCVKGRGISIFFGYLFNDYRCRFLSPNKWPKCRFQKAVKLSRRNELNFTSTKLCRITIALRFSN